MNYLEHETKVKFVDGLLSHSQDWQWFIEQVEENYEIKTITSWNEFCKHNSATREILTFFVKILRVCQKEWIFSKIEFREIWLVAKCYMDIENVEKCIDEISVAHCKIMFFCVWVAKLKNSSNENKYLYDINIFTQKNYHQIMNLDYLVIHEDQIIQYAESIELDGMEEPLSCLRCNINGEECMYSDDFFAKYENKLINCDSFSFQTIKKDYCATWQETYLLDMLQTSIEDRMLTPLYSGNGIFVPDIEAWSPEILKEMKAFFNHQVADFILETVMYIKHNIEPSTQVKLMHCKLLLEKAITTSELNQIRFSSSYKVVSYLFKDKKLHECKGNPDYISLILQFQKCSDPQLIMTFKEDGIPISKDQKLIMETFYDNCYKLIDEVDSTNQLLNYLRDKKTTRLIDAKYLQKVSDKFNLYITQDKTNLVATLFYEYMLFLLEINLNNSKLNIRTIHKEMIRVQKIWEEKYFEKQCSNLHEFTHEISIEKDKLAQYNDIIVLDPIILARDCIPCTEAKVLSVMESTSENVLQFMIFRMNLDAIYPKKATINFERHDVDKKLLEYVGNLIETQGYRFLNILEPEKYVKALHEQYTNNVMLVTSILPQEKELYEIIQNDVELKLSPYSEEVNLGMLVQLFPILEIKIRELATLLGFFPFKKCKEEFMEANDPSSLLREMLLEIYDEQHSFENVPDFLFVYNVMYNSNSLNIRNECIHGRRYVIGNEMRFAFKVTMLAILMVKFRIETIKDNVSDLTEDVANE